MIGFKPFYVNLTRGEGLLMRSFAKYAPHCGPLGNVRKGVLVASASGSVTRYALTGGDFAACTFWWHMQIYSCLYVLHTHCSLVGAVQQLCCNAFELGLKL